MTRRAWHLLALLTLLAVVARGELAEAGSTVFGLLEVTIGGVHQPGVSRLELPSGSTCDGGACTIVGSAAIDAGTYEPALDSGTYATTPAGCTAGSVVTALDDAGRPSCATNVSIDPSGSITLPPGATVDGRELSTDGTKLDGLPAQAVSQSQVNPADAGKVSGFYEGQGYGSGADTGVAIAACTVEIPNNSACTFKVHWNGKQVGDAATGLTPSAIGDVERVYHVRSGTSGIAAVSMTLGAGDSNNLTGTYAGTDFDGGVADPKIRGNGNPIWWTCRVSELHCNSI